MASNKVTALKKKDDDSMLEESGSHNQVSKRGGNQESGDNEDAQFDIE